VLLAADPERSWSLAQDMGGCSLEGATDVGVWEETLRSYARLQKASLDHLDELSPFCEDSRLGKLVDSFASLIEQLPAYLEGFWRSISEDERHELRELLPGLKESALEIERSGVPATLDHGDFHPTNVQITDTEPVFFDWTQGCINHPFVRIVELLCRDDPSLLPRPEASDRLRAVYLAEWSDFLPMEKAEQLLDRMDPFLILHLINQNRRLLGFIQTFAGASPARRNSGVDWSLRQEQTKLWTGVRSLLDLKRGDRPF